MTGDVLMQAGKQLACVCPAGLLLPRKCARYLCRIYSHILSHYDQEELANRFCGSQPIQSGGILSARAQ